MFKLKCGCVFVGICFCLFAFTSNSTNPLSDKVEKLKREKKLVSLHPDEKLKQSEKYSNAEIIALGKQLFNDKALSRNQNVSCGSCHLENKGFSSGESFGTGTHGNLTKRNVPHLYNLDLNMSFFWDGRVSSLEDQLNKVITSKDELDMNFDDLVIRLKATSEYKSKFDTLFPKRGVTKGSISQALLSYEKNILSFSSAYDNYLDGDTNALTGTQKKGLEVFISKGNCIACHKGVNLSDNEFHNVGVKTNDIGRSEFDKIGMKNEFESTPYPFFSTFKAFRTPTLRNVSNTAPYFHDGSKKTLREVLDNYIKGGENPEKTGLAKEIKPLDLNEQEIESLLDFLTALSSPNY